MIKTKKRTKFWKVEVLTQLLSYLKGGADKKGVLIDYSVGHVVETRQSAMRIFFLWVLNIAGVASLKLTPFKIWELSEPYLGTQTRVYGGTVAKEGEFPFMIFFLLKNERGSFKKCSASLLLPGWVLTAAHCLNSGNMSSHSFIMIGGKADLTDYITQRIKVGFGNNINESNLEVQERRAQEIHIHPEYIKSEDEMLHDIALIKLEKPFIITENLKPMSLNFDKIYNRITCTILGWGNTPRQQTYQLHVVRKKNISTASIGCEYAYRKPLICLSRDRLSGICVGDSGSPLVCNKKVVGVASYFMSYTMNCEDSLEDYYTELSSEKNWIQSVLNTGSKTVKTDLIEAFIFVFIVLRISPNIL